MFQGNIGKVEVYKHEKDAIWAWSDFTGKEYYEMDTDGLPVEGIEIVKGTDYEGSAVYETEIN